MAHPGLVHSRAVVKRNYAILPLAGVAVSALPEWTNTVARVLAAPAMGARFAEYLLELGPRGGSDQRLAETVEAFFFVLEGEIGLTHDGRARNLKSGGFAYLNPGTRFTVEARSAARLLWLKKVYQPFGQPPTNDLVGNEADMPGETYMGIEGLLLKTLLPADPSFDMAMNIFTFPPGFSLPVVETHVMEHGLWMLEGRGVYYLGDTWYEVEAGDFIWMGPYVPQSFYATGNTPSRYIYYKDVHRDVAL
jgi:(S)-ureidoglycine aminohydrolase